MLIHDWVNQQLYKTVGTIKYIVALFYSVFWTEFASVLE